jgi:dolichyl-phosphate-mannose--protein O-mannosyl transferase
MSAWALSVLFTVFSYEIFEERRPNLRLRNRVTVFTFHALFFASFTWLCLVTLGLQLSAAITRLVLISI